MPWLLRSKPQTLVSITLSLLSTTKQKRDLTETAVWGEMTDDTGERAAARLHGPEGGHVWTAAAVIGFVQRILGGDATPGFQTPSTAYGPDLIFDVDGVVREDVV